MLNKLSALCYLEWTAERTLNTVQLYDCFCKGEQIYTWKTIKRLYLRLGHSVGSFRVIIWQNLTASLCQLLQPLVLLIAWVINISEDNKFLWLCLCLCCSGLQWSLFLLCPLSCLSAWHSLCEDTLSGNSSWSLKNAKQGHFSKQINFPHNLSSQKRSEVNDNRWNTRSLDFNFNSMIICDTFLVVLYKRLADSLRENNRAQKYNTSKVFQWKLSKHGLCQWNVQIWTTNWLHNHQLTKATLNVEKTVSLVVAKRTISSHCYRFSWSTSVSTLECSQMEVSWNVLCGHWTMW